MPLGRKTSLAFHTLVALAMLLGQIPGNAFANDLSTLPCTAEDVEIVGSGIVINEPCSCTPGSTFNATVQFTVRNNTSTGRYCISLHLIPDGVVLTQPVDVVLRDINGVSTAPGKSGGARYKDTIMYGTIPNYPCNAGITCFGSAGVVRGKCSPGECTTVSWNTSNGAATCTVADQSPPGGQCRHQQVCVIGYGATLQCTANCNVSCGNSATLRACVVGPMDRGPYQMTLVGDDGSSATQSTFGDASGTACLNFTVNPTKSPTTTYTLTVTDKNGCTRTATASVGVTPTTATITPPANPGCNGVLVYTASVSGQTCSFTWTVDGQSLATFLAGGGADDARVARVSGTGSTTFAFRALDGACHTIGVTASCPNGNQTPCTATASTKVKQCVGNTTNCP
ncbi:MAG TPA: hypothetical protein VFQ05_04030 [Candidatus Eisenbacteria bacterium]|nr:hypothetical protein [Candidatus Eisenbacteria bacterium]